MLYLGIRELSRYAEQVFVASNSLVKDMNSNLGEEYKANAIRTLRTITDVHESFSNYSQRLGVHVWHFGSPSKTGCRRSKC